MTILQRQQVRTQVLQREFAYANRRAASYRLSGTCREAMEVTHKDPATARELHGRCAAEEPGGPGCLCLCHDEITGEVTSGVSG